MWWVQAELEDVLALAAVGELREAIALRNTVTDRFRASQEDPAKYDLGMGLLRAVHEALRAAEAESPIARAPLQIAPLFRYVVGYPRSGNTLIQEFLCYAFGAPRYSVYCEKGARYFSRRFHERAPGHAVFVKDHVLDPAYLEDEILSPVRDGRTSIVSLARFLYGQGANRFVRRGELADFISYVAATMPYGFWGDHTNALLDARDRGARIRLVHYADVFGDFRQLRALAHEIANGLETTPDDERAFTAYSVARKRRLSSTPGWRESIDLPDDSFIPKDWSIGGETIDWRQAFDAPARRRFHEFGGTEALLRLGYETDEGWWRAT